MSPPASQPKLSALPRILVLDDDPSVGRDLQDMLRPRHLEVIAPPIGGPRADDQAETLARRHRPHVIILDLRIKDHHRDDRTGLAVLGRLPDVPCILYSNWLSLEISRQAQDRHKDVRCVPKTDAPAILVSEISRAARVRCAARCRKRIVAGAHCDLSEILATLFPGKPELPPSMMEDLLHRLFPRPQTMTVERLSVAHSASAPASRGHSVVCKVTREGYAPFVVKFGPADKIEREAHHYERYVHDRLADRFHSEMHTWVTFWEAGAASYRLIGSGGSRLETLSELYARCDDLDLLLRPLRHFFAGLWGQYYQSPRTTYSGPLYELYNRALHMRTRLKNQALLRHVAAAIGSDSPNPPTWLEQHCHESSWTDIQCVVNHGDLHGDNLFVDGDHAWAIDFERTGPGHILRDFAELEVDILTRLAPVPADDPAAVLAFYQTSVLLTPGAIPARMGGWAETGEGQKALAVLAGLRQLSREVTGRWRTEEYLWALLFDTVFLLSLASPDSPQWRCALLLSIVLCRQLEEMRHAGEEQVS